MAIKNLETIESVETPETKEDLKNLKLDIFGNTNDRKKFETLSNDSDIQSWIRKIEEKWLSSKINNFEKTYNMYTKESVDYYTWNLLEKRPDLFGLIWWKLGLPIDRSEKIKFSALSFDQKLGFMALMNVYWDYTGDWFKKAKISDIIGKYIKYKDDFWKEAAEDLNKQMENNKVVGNLTKYEKVMKSYYWLTDVECKKIEEYFKLIAKHPEYVWWEVKIRYQEAGLWWSIVKPIIKWALIIWIPFVVGVVVGYKVKEWRDKVYSIKEPQMKQSGDGKEAVTFKKAYDKVPGYTKISNDTLTFEKEAYGYYDENSWTWVEKQVKKGVNWVKEKWNKVQKRKVTVVSDSEVWYFYDSEKMDIIVEKKDWKWYVHIKLKEDPKIKVTDRKIEVVGKATRELIHMKKLDNFDFEVAEKADSAAISHAKSKERRREADKSFVDNIFSDFQRHWWYTDVLQIPAKDFVGVTIEYEWNSTDPELYENIPVAPPYTDEGQGSTFIE